MSLITSAGSQDAEEEISLPEDLLTDILWKMAGQNVYEFRRLSKYYKELIDGEDFIRNHYNLSIRKTPSIIIQQKIEGEGNRREVVVATYLNLETGDCKRFRPPLNDDEEFRRLMGSQRGILCYHATRKVAEKDSYKDHIVFWNPLTGACRRVINKMETQWNSRDYFLGYDAETDDLKVLAITTNFLREGLIYSSKTGSWTEIRLSFCEAEAYRKCTGTEVFVEGTNCVHVLAPIHYRGFYIKHRYCPIKILAFDFRAGKMKSVSLPESCPKITYATVFGNAGLSAVDGCLCLSYQLPSRDDNMNLWMMKKHGDKRSWSLLFSIQPGSLPKDIKQLVDFVVIRGRPQLLFRANRYKVDLYLYDVQQKQFNADAQERHHFLHYQTLGLTQHCLFVPSRRKP